MFRKGKVTHLYSSFNHSDKIKGSSRVLWFIIQTATHTQAAEVKKQNKILRHSNLKQNKETLRERSKCISSINQSPEEQSQSLILSCVRKDLFC